MPPPDLPPSFPLPAVHAALAPYISTPTETLQTRQILSAHLQSLTSLPRISNASGSTDEFTRFLDLSLGPHPSIHRDYLSALRQNAAARAEYNAALASLPHDEPEEQPAEQQQQEDGWNDWKHTYMTVLQLDRQHKRLKVLQEGVGMLAAITSSRPPGGLAGAYTAKPPPPPPSLNPGTSHTNSDVQASISHSINTIVLALKKRILETRESLNRQQAHLKFLPRPEPGAPPSRAALEATQAELLGWLDTALEAPTTETPTLPSSSTAAAAAAAPANSTPEATLASIDSAYSNYLHSRESLLATLSRPLDPSAVPPFPADSPIDATARLDPAPPPVQPNVLAILAAVEHLLPLSHAQKSALAALNSHGAKMLQMRGELAEVFETGEAEEEVRRVVGRANARFGKAVTQAERGVEAAKGSLCRAEKEGEEVAGLVGVRVGKRGIPVKGEGKKKGLWEGLDGGVGVIGDGI